MAPFYFYSEPEDEQATEPGIPVIPFYVSVLRYAYTVPKNVSM